MNINRVSTPLFAIIFCFFSQYAIAQNFATYSLNPQGGAITYSLEKDGSNIDGHPYVNPEWKSGSIYFKNSEKVDLDKIKFNANTNEIIFNFDNKSYQVPDREEISNFTLGDSDFIGAFDKKNDYHFYEVEVNGNRMALLKKYRTTIVKGTPTKGYIEGTKDKYVLKTEYYVKTANKNVEHIKLTKGIYILDYVENYQGEVKFYIKENKLKMKSIEDLKEVVTYYNNIGNN